MQKTNIRNVLFQALKPRRLIVMLQKVRKRLLDDKGMHSKDENLKWIISHCSSFEKLAMDLASTLWEEAKRVSLLLENRAKKILKDVEYNLGGGGIYPFLYFITRYTKASCIVETGVAAGFSSYAFLAAIRDNGKGRLYSSDFPYFRLPNPERYIGIILEESLKKTGLCILMVTMRIFQRFLMRSGK